jgi:alpha-galactosidase
MIDSNHIKKLADEISVAANKIRVAIADATVDEVSKKTLNTSRAVAVYAPQDLTEMRDKFADIMKRRHMNFVQVGRETGLSYSATRDFYQAPTRRRTAYFIDRLKEFIKDNEK